MVIVVTVRFLLRTWAPSSVITFNQLHDEMVALLEPMDGIIGLRMKNIAQIVKSNFHNRRWSWATAEGRKYFLDDYGTLVACAPRRQGLDPSEPTPLSTDEQSATETNNVPVLLTTSMTRSRARPRAEKRRPPYVKKRGSLPHQCILRRKHHRILPRTSTPVQGTFGGHLDCHTLRSIQG